MRAVKRFFSQSVLVGKAMLGPFNWLEFLCYQVGYTLLTLVFYCLLASFTTGAVDLSRWIVGNALVLCVNTCVYMLGVMFNGERYAGRLRVLIVSPTHLLVIILHKALVPIAISLATIAGGFVAGALIFRADFAAILPHVFLLAALAASFAAAGLGLLLAVVALLSDSMYLILNVIGSLIMLLSGANFPTTQLPLFAQQLAKLFPLHRAVAAAQMCFGDYDGGLFLRLIGGEVLLGACFYLAAAALLRAIERAAIKHATLEMF